MLVLNRRIGEAIIIADGVTVKVLDVSGSRVRLGIEAPPEVPVHRAEVYKLLQSREEELTVNEAALLARAE